MLDTSRYLNIEEVNQLLNQFCETYPSLCRLQKIGESTAGQSLQLLIISVDLENHQRHPAVWLDGATHAIEWSGYMACLTLADALLKELSSKKDDTDPFTYYIYPMVSPDGVRFIQENYTYCRSTDRCDSDYPMLEKGWQPKNFSGQPGIFQFRWRSSLGSWKKHPENDALMIPREILDDENIDGPFYHVVCEGEFVGFEAEDIHQNLICALTDTTQFRADYNRNWPCDWFSSQNPSESGYGDYAGSVPEVKAVLEFLNAHRNICVVNTHHTHGGVHIIPTGNNSEREMDRSDYANFKFFQEIADKTTGYDITFLKDDIEDAGYIGVTLGVFDTYAYYSLGALATTTEIWNHLNEIAPEKREKNWLRDFSKMGDASVVLDHFAWSQQNCPEIFLPWKPFKHPQLGDMEVGGWNIITAYANPPPSYLATELEKMTQFNLALSKLLPRLEIVEKNVKSLSDSIKEITIYVGNRGVLPPHVMSTTLGKRWYKGVSAKIYCDEKIALLSKEEHKEKDSLSGAIRHKDTWDHSYFAMLLPKDQGLYRFTWTVRGTGKVRIEVDSQRAGHCSVDLELTD